MHKVNQCVNSTAVPFVGRVKKRKIDLQEVRVVDNSDFEILEVKTGKTVETRVIKILEFEKKRWPYILTLPISWLLTFWVMLKKTVCRFFGKEKVKTNTFWFDGLGLSCRKIKENAASWTALDEIYNYRFGQNGFKGAIDDFWVGMINAQAVRNRLKLVRQKIREALIQFGGCQEIRILSLASGSAQAVIEIMAELKKEEFQARVLLVDIDRTALDYANQLAECRGVSGQVETVNASVAQVERISKKFQPQIIEMVGLLDYISRNKAIRLIGKILESLPNNGVFLTSNIAPNPEMYFLQWVINWSMIYRAPNELLEVIAEAGASSCQILYEPLEIHGLAIVKKE